MAKDMQEQLALYGKKQKSALVQPFLKWAGGKRQLWPSIQKYIPPAFGTYYEPFVGAGAVLFSLQPERAVINDINPELMNCYRIIRDLSPYLIEDLKKHRNEEAYFYRIRGLDRKQRLDALSAVERASRMIYLNKTCFNGLFRVNRSGQFNVPFGRYQKPEIINPEVITAVSKFLNGHEVDMLNTDYRQALATARRGDFVYLDPPYDPVSLTASFTAYNPQRFGKSEQKELRNVFEELTLRGCLVMMSNASTAYIEALYGGDYNMVKVSANRNINCNGEGRKKIDEFLIMNYPAPDEA